MPFTVRDNVRLYWRLEGATDRPPLLLLNSIGTDLHLWDAVVPFLLPAFQLLRMDMRGHGASDSPEGDYSLAMLAEDARAVMEDAGVGRPFVAGVSLGGMVAMELALRHPQLVSALALVCTSARMDKASWQDRTETVRTRGTEAIARMAVGRFLSPDFAAQHPEIAAGLERAIVAQSDTGYAGASAAIRDMALAGRIGGMAVPVLVVTGEEDISAPYTGHGEQLVHAIPGARHAEVAGAHLPPIEVPTHLAAVLRRFFLEKPGITKAGQTLFEAGLLNRRRVLGDAWVDKALAGRTAFNSEFQEMITRIAWQEVWGRPGLDDRTRRLIVLAVTASLGRWEEFQLHVRSGLLQKGFTLEELKELLMQVAVYAGVPAANTGFSEAGEVLAELDRK